MVIGKYLLEGGTLPKGTLHKETMKGARRTYQYYSIGDNLEGPTPRQLAKMRRPQFEEVFRARKLLFGEALLESDDNSAQQSRDNNNPAVSEDIPLEELGLTELTANEVTSESHDWTIV